MFFGHFPGARLQQFKPSDLQSPSHRDFRTLTVVGEGNDRGVASALVPKPVRCRGGASADVGMCGCPNAASEASGRHVGPDSTA